MADYRQSSKSSKDMKTKYTSRRERFSNEDNFQGKRKIPTTPPLQASKKHSTEKILQQRDNLKRNTEGYKKHSDSDLNRKHKSHKKRRDYSYDEFSNKRGYSGNAESVTKKKRPIDDFSPERNGDYYCESEDEDSIIEKRRQERKKLVEKFNTFQTPDMVEKAYTISLYKEKFNKKETTKSATVLKEVTDMFSDKDDFTPDLIQNRLSSNSCEINAEQLSDNWDDSEGYYNINVGDVLNNQYIIKKLLGKGVFSNVVHAQDTEKNYMDVAVKIVRNVDLMYTTSIKEIAFLKDIGQEDPENKYHCIKFFTYFKHKGHLCLVLESLSMDLRSVIKKYGKHGLNMKALTSYSRQLLVALRLLLKMGIIHGDVKPDNILVNEKKNVLKLCDFGSASYLSDVEPTPYLVSRFYRAPEIILGIPYTHSIDIWSAACTIYEMATGKIMFAGSSNNKMLKCFMDMKGRFPIRFIKKGKFKDQHFNYNNHFLLHKRDEFSEREKYVEVTNIPITRDINKELKKYTNTSGTIDDKKVSYLKDLLEKMTTIDIIQRMSANECLKHPFIQH